MGLFDYSSSPLSSIMPQSSPYLLPDYANAFKMNWQPKLNNLLFKTGLSLSGSSDFTNAFNGRMLRDDAINLNNNSLLLTTSSTNNLNNTTNLTINTGLLTLGLVGEQVGGTAGLIMQGASKVGTSIKNLSDASKAVGGFKNLSGVGKAGGIGAIAGAASDMIGSFMPEKTEYSGDKGDITQTMDSVYDGISDAAMSFGPIGMMVGGIMKGGALLGKGMNALGGGTDGMTNTDAILGSSFLNLTPLGLINGFGGAKADTITKDDEAFELVGSSYTGSNSTIDDAVHKSGKKYGLFSSGARKKANEEIAEAKRQLSIISNISEDVQDRMALKTSMSAINANRRAFNMQGGYNQSAIRIGKHGMLLEKARNILKAQKGNKLTPVDTYYKTIPQNWETIPETGKPSYLDWVKDVNPDFINDNYDLEGAYNNFPYELVLKWKFAVNSKNPDYYMDYHEGDYYPFHLTSVAPLQGTEDYIFLKKGKEDTNPELHWETDTYYNGTNGLKDTHNLVYEGDRYYYRKKKSDVKLETPQHKNGGSVILLVDYKELPEFKNGGSVIELVKESIIELIDPFTIPEFKNGGSVNVLPEGALHARKHNMDLDGVTEKGIPVVSNDGELLAEIEKEEIIFRLEVTKKLEELEKKYNDDNSSLKEKDLYALEAGELLVEEILHNTDDKTGLINTLKKGGVIEAKDSVLQSDIDKMVKLALINILTQNV